MLKNLYKNLQNPFIKTKAKKNIFFQKTNCWHIPVLFFINPSSEKYSLWDSILEFYKIWPPFQWMTSLLTLVLMYWISGYYYNKFLSKKGGGWMDWKTRILMIFFDLLLNFSLGIYYMNYRETFLGTLMIHCPVFCSPVFWLFELVCFYIYYKYFASFKNQKQ